MVCDIGIFTMTMTTFSPPTPRTPATCDLVGVVRLNYKVLW